MTGTHYLPEERDAFEKLAELVARIVDSIARRQRRIAAALNNISR